MSDNLVIQTAYGPVRGFTDTAEVSIRSGMSPKPDTGSLPGVDKWLGIPYAQAKRFQHPQPPSSWTDSLDCVQFGPMCPQPLSPFVRSLVRANVRSAQKLWATRPGYYRREAPQDEHRCLNLNVFAPPGSRSKLPVIVYFYGGSLRDGHTSNVSLDPTDWIRRSVKDGKPFLFVSVTYRVNVFGFITHADLGKDSGNCGLRDALESLRWTKRNISAFGGDPDNTTVSGQSAGSILSTYLILSGQNLVRRALLLAGTATTFKMLPRHEAPDLWSKMLERFKIQGNTAEERVEAMRQVSVDDLLAFVDAHFGFGNYLAVQDDIWTDDPLDKLRRGELDESVEAVMAGFTAQEGAFLEKIFLTHVGTLFTETDPNQTRDNFLAFYRSSYYPLPTAIVDDLYPANEPQVAERLIADALFDAPSIHLAQHALRAGRKAYVYRVDAAPSGLIGGDIAHLGPTHEAELPLVFSMQSMLKTEADHAASRAIGDAFVDFASGKQPFEPFKAGFEQLHSFKADGVAGPMKLDEKQRARIQFFIDAFDGDSKDTIDEKLS